MNKEIWKDIKGYEGLYQVSNLGRVKSMDKEVDNGRGCYLKKGKILKQINNGAGRKQVFLYKDGKATNQHVYILVAESFIGERPKGYDVCHLDGDCTNNKLSNLRYDTRSQNQIDLYRQGKKSGTGKLSIEQVLKIRQLYTTGKYSQRELAEKFNVHQNNISRVINRKTYSYINDDGTIDNSSTAVS